MRGLVVIDGGFNQNQSSSFCYSTMLPIGGLRKNGYIAAQVIEMDAVRERTLDSLAILAPRERENAMARIAENRIVIWWTHQELKERANRYAYALERLLIETPDRSAITVERSLMALRAAIAATGPYDVSGMTAQSSGQVTK